MVVWVVVDKLKPSPALGSVSSCCITRMGGGSPGGILITASFKWLVSFLLSFWKLVSSCSHQSSGGGFLLLAFSMKLCFVLFFLFCWTAAGWLAVLPSVTATKETNWKKLKLSLVKTQDHSISPTRPPGPLILTSRTQRSRFRIWIVGL